MESLLVTPSTAEEMHLIRAFVEKMRLTPRILSEDEVEDIGLGMLMMEADRNDRVPRDEIMRKLAS